MKIYQIPIILLKILRFHFICWKEYKSCYNNTIIFYFTITDMLLYLLTYIILINLITFIIRGIDKRKAKHHKRRISENTLLRLSLAWGRIGAISAIGFFRHKTIKSSFLWRFYLIGFIWICGLIALAVF